jgi:hypothetical protein
MVSFENFSCDAWTSVPDLPLAAFVPPLTVCWPSYNCRANLWWLEQRQNAIW